MACHSYMFLLMVVHTTASELGVFCQTPFRPVCQTIAAHGFAMLPLPAPWGLGPTSGLADAKPKQSFVSHRCITPTTVGCPSSAVQILSCFASQWIYCAKHAVPLPASPEAALRRCAASSSIHHGQLEFRCLFQPTLFCASCTLGSLWAWLSPTASSGFRLG
jgi:hypothetical protein